VVVTYQPASRFWPFQWAEAGIPLAAALALCGFTTGGYDAGTGDLAFPATPLSPPLPYNSLGEASGKTRDERSSQEAAMNNTTGGGRGLRHPGAVAVITAVAVLVAACGGGRPSSSARPASTESASYRANLAYADCMQAHGLPNFPNPNPSGPSNASGQLNGGGGDIPAAQANDACKHLLPGGTAATGGTTAPATTAPPGPGASPTQPRRGWRAPRKSKTPSSSTPSHLTPPSEKS
jgi:hypothetical protein